MTDPLLTLVARAMIVHNRQMVGDEADYAYADQILASEDAGDAGEAFAARELAQAALSVIREQEGARIEEFQAEIERLQAEIERLTPRYPQPCFDHEYITTGCPDCGKLA